jgi:hypothetical protein
MFLGVSGVRVLEAGMSEEGVTVEEDDFFGIIFAQSEAWQ